MKFLITILLLLSYFSSTSQEHSNESKYELGFLDSYVIKVKIKLDSPIAKGRDYCAYKKGTKCSLYKMAISEILYSPRDGLDTLNMKKMPY